MTERRACHERSTRHGWSPALPFTLVLVLASFAVLPLATRGYTTRGPIVIGNNGEFTAVNGVAGGSGTSTDPYVIEGWEINASSADGIRVSNTDVIFIIRDVFVHSGRATSPGHTGVLLQNVSNALVQNVRADDNAQGIWVYSSRNVTASGNLLWNNAAGVRLWQSRDVTVTDNKFRANRYGLWVESSESATVARNEFEGDGLIIDGSAPSHFDTHKVPMGNTVNGMPLIYVARCADVTFSRIEIGQLIAASCANVRVLDSIISGTDVGVQLAFVNDSIVSGTKVEFSELDGIRIFSSSSVTVVQSEVGLSGATGIIIRKSPQARVVGSRLLSNPSAITVVDSPEPKIDGNALTSNTFAAVTLLNSSLAIIRGNFVSGGNGGIVADYSSNSTLIGNTIVATASGVSILSTSMGAVAYHNNFVRNVLQAYDERGPENSWQTGYPSGGNYWSDYAGPDNCAGPNQNDCTRSDGVGDVPYSIDADSEDRFPLMLPSVVDLPPTAVAESLRTSGSVGEVFTFDSTHSTDDFGIVERHWTFDDGVSTDQAVAEHAFLVPGTHTASLTVRDTAGQEDADAVSIIVRAQLPGGLHGFVVDDRDSPISGALVVVKNTTGVMGTSRTSSNGSFQFDNLPPGTYSVSGQADGFLPSESQVIVSAGQISTVRIRLSQDRSTLYLVGFVVAALFVALAAFLLLRKRRGKGGDTRP